MSIKLFCDICRKEVLADNNMTQLPARSNFIKVNGQSVTILLSLKVGIKRWGEGEICQSCTLEAVEGYLKGVGSITRMPSQNE